MIVKPKYMEEHFGVPRCTLCTSGRYSPFYTRATGKQKNATFNLGLWLKANGNISKRDKIVDIIGALVGVVSIYDLAEKCGISYQAVYSGRYGYKKALVMLEFLITKHKSDVLKACAYYEYDINDLISKS